MKDKVEKVIERKDSREPSIKSTNPSTSQGSFFKTIEKVNQTMCEMFSDRKYTLLPKPIWNKKDQQFEDLKMIATKSHKTDYVYVFFATDPKVSVKKMREYLLHMHEQNVTHGIVVYGHQITPGARGVIENGYDVEFFQAKELFENKTKHYLVPKHEKVETEEDVQNLLKELHIPSKNHLPQYKPDDMVVKYHHWPVGSVIKIYRKLGNQREPEIYYRHVRI